MSPEQWLAQQSPEQWLAQQNAAAPAQAAQPAAPAAPVPTRADAAAQSQQRAAERTKLQQQAQKNSFLQRLAGSAASTVDIAPKAVAGIIEPISYAIARPFNTPEEAKAVSESAGRAVPTLGRLFGLEGQPEYTDPFTAASEAISKVVAPYTQAATQAIGEATDTSPIDISNLAALAGMGAGIPVARRAPSAVTQATEAPGRLGGAIQEGAINAADFLVPGRGDIIRRNIEAKKLEKAQAAQAANEANNAAIDLGLKIVPRDLRIADPDTAFKVAATHNARKLAEDLFFTFAGIPKNNKVNSAAFEGARKELAEKGYGPIYDAPPVSTPSPETISKIDDIRRSSDFEKDKRGRPVPPAPVQNTLNQISEIFGKSEVSPGKVLKLVTDLRSNTKAYRDSLWRGDFIAHDKSIVPEAQIKLADTLENWLDNNIPQKDVQKYRETRQKLRELYDLEASTDFNTGTINPEQYVKRTASGEIKDTASWQYKLGTAAGMYPESFKLPEPRSASSVLTQTASRATVPGIAAGAILQNMGLDGWTIAAGALGAVMTAELAARQLGKSAARVPGTRMPVLPSVQRAAEATRQAQEDMQRSAAGRKPTPEEVAERVKRAAQKQKQTTKPQ